MESTLNLSDSNDEIEPDKMAIDSPLRSEKHKPSKSSQEDITFGNRSSNA